MPVVRTFRYSRLIEFINKTGETIEDVRLNCGFLVFGSANWPLAGSLADGGKCTLAFEGKNHRVSSLFVTYRRPGSGTVVRSPLLQTPVGAYFRWLRTELGPAEFHGVGRAQGALGPSYNVGWFSGVPIEAADDLVSADMGRPAADSNAGAAGTRFFELLNFSKRDLDIQSLTLATADDELTELAVDKLVRPGDYLEIDFSGELQQVIGFKLNHRVDGTVNSIKADFSLISKQWLRYGSVVFRGNEREEDKLEWQGSTEDADGLVRQQLDGPTLRPQVFVEPDPNPEFPDAACMTPMRVRNGERYPVTVRLLASFKSEGSRQYCTNQVITEPEPFDRVLAPFESQHLGCSWYKTANMMCTELRSWKPVWSLALPSDLNER
jgi:hypothetical protein